MSFFQSIKAKICACFSSKPVCPFGNLLDFTVGYLTIVQKNNKDLYNFFLTGQKTGAFSAQQAAKTFSPFLFAFLNKRGGNNQAGKSGKKVGIPPKWLEFDHKNLNILLNNQFFSDYKKAVPNFREENYRDLELYIYTKIQATAAAHVPLESTEQMWEEWCNLDLGARLTKAGFYNILAQAYKALGKNWFCHSPFAKVPFDPAYYMLAFSALCALGQTSKDNAKLLEDFSNLKAEFYVAALGTNTLDQYGEFLGQLDKLEEEIRDKVVQKQGLVVDQEAETLSKTVVKATKVIGTAAAVCSLLGPLFGAVGATASSWAGMAKLAAPLFFASALWGDWFKELTEKIFVHKQPVYDKSAQVMEKVFAYIREQFAKIDAFGKPSTQKEAENRENQRKYLLVAGLGVTEGYDESVALYKSIWHKLSNDSKIYIKISVTMPRKEWQRIETAIFNLTKCVEKEINNCVFKPFHSLNPNLAKLELSRDEGISRTEKVLVDHETVMLGSLYFIAKNLRAEGCNGSLSVQKLAEALGPDKDVFCEICDEINKPYFGEKTGVVKLRNITAHGSDECEKICNEECYRTLQALLAEKPVELLAKITSIKLQEPQRA